MTGPRRQHATHAPIIGETSTALDALKGSPSGPRPVDMVRYAAVAEHMRRVEAELRSHHAELVATPLADQRVAHAVLLAAEHTRNAYLSAAIAHEVAKRKAGL